MENIKAAAVAVFGPRLVQGPEAIPMSLLLDLLKNIGYALLFGNCRPQPDDVAKQLSRKFGPIQKLLGAERRRDSQVRQLIAEHWNGDRSLVAAIHADIKRAGREGKITEELVVGVFQDVHASRRKWMDDLRHSE